MRKSFLKLVVLGISLSGLVSSVHAAEEFLQHSHYGSGTPYKIVRKSDDPQLPNGIYVANESGDWEIAFPGNVLAGETNQGLIGEFSLTHFTGQYEGAAIVDGKLLVFNIQSRASDATSFVEFGESSIEPIDFLSQAKFKLSSISNLKDVSVAFLPHTSGGQAFLVSIAQPNPFGNGISFLGLLKKNRDGILELKTNPVIIDYSYRDRVDLERLIVDNRFVLSPLVLQRFSVSSNREGAEVVNWRGGLSLALSQLNDGVVSSKSGQTLPLIDSETFEIQLQKKPLRMLPFGDYSLAQVTDPISHRHEIWIGRGNQAEPLRSGQIHLTADSENYVFYPIENPYSAALFVSEGNLYFLKLGSANGRLTKNVISLGRAVDPDGSGSHVFILKEIEGPNGRLETFVFHSWNLENEDSDKGTEVYRVVNKGESVGLDGKMLLSHDFIPQDVLDARIKNHPLYGILFDNLSAETFDLVEYEGKFDSALPLINVGSSLDGGSQIVQSYLRPVAQIPIGNSFEYLEYDPRQAISNQSGIFWKAGSNDPAKTLVTAELLYDEQNLDFGEKVVAGAPVTFTEKEHERKYDFSLACIDKQFNGGRRGFSLAAILEGEGDVAFEFTDLELGYSRVRNIQIINAFGQNERHIIGVIEIDKVPGDENKENRTGVFIFDFEVEKPRSSNGNRTKISLARKVFIPAENLDSQRVEDRIGADQNGKIYWNLSANIDPRKPEFAVYDIIEGRKILPNSQRGRSIVFGPQAKELGLSVRQRDRVFRHDNPWVIKSQKSLKRIAEYENKEDEKDLGDALKLYQGLVSHLEALGDVAKPAQHEILLVTPAQKKVLRKLLRFTLDSYQNDSRIWNLYSSQTDIAWIDSEVADQLEIIKNLQSLASSAHRSRSLVLADMQDLIRLDRPSSVGESDHLVYKEAASESHPEAVLPHILELIQREGAVHSSDDFQSPASAYKFSSVIIATPEELESLDLDHTESDVLSSFETNVDFIEASWRVWPPNTTRASAAVQSISKTPRNDMEKELLSDLFDHIEELCDTSKPAARRVFIIPDELKTLVDNILMRAWAQPGTDESSLFNYRNERLRLFRPDGQEVNQSKAFENFRAMRGTGDVRSLFWANLDSLIKINRPAESTATPYFISDPADVGENGEPGQKVPPHISWMIATDGRRLNAEEVSSGLRALSSTLLIGTQREWEELERNLEFENRFGVLDQFKVYQLEAPDIRTMVKVLNQILDRPSIAALRYRFVTDQYKEDSVAARSELISFIVNKTKTLAQQYGIEGTSAFLRVVVQFQTALVEDQNLRRSRLIDRKFMDRLLTKVFNIPLNIANLPEDDPDRLLSDAKRVVLNLQSAGYLGPLELKYRVVETLLSHIRGKTAGLNVPSSLILLGDTSTGKTFLFKKLAEVLGLKFYDFEDPTNPEANAIIVNVGEITETEGDPRNIDEMIAHLENFLCLPNGYRGFILFDDLHKAGSTKILQKLIAFQQRLFEAKNGMIVAEPWDADYVKEVPVRNLKMIITLNPPSDAKLRERFASSGEDVDMVVASLVRDGLNIERSFPARFSSIINLSQFPLEAKGPALAKHLSDQVQMEFNTQGRFTLVDPSAVQLVSRAFPNSHAREFLNTAGASIRELPAKANLTEPISLVVPVNKKMDLDSEVIEGETPKPGSYPKAWEATGRSQEKIESFIDQSMIAIPLSEKNLTGNLILLSMLAEGARTHIYQSLVSAATESPRLNDGREIRRLMLAPLLNALTSHLQKHPKIPLSVLHIDPYDYGITSKFGKEEFEKTLSQIDGGEVTEAYFPIQFADEFRAREIYDLLNVRGFTGRQMESRVDVLTTTSDEIVGLTEKILGTILRIPDVHQFPEAEVWLRQLPDEDPQSGMREFGDQLLQKFWDFHSRLVDPSLHEARQGEAYVEPTTYESFRLFLLALDRALLRLPWVKAEKFLLKGMTRAVGDLEFGQLSGVQNYFFQSRISALRPPSRSFIVQLARSSTSDSGWTPEEGNARDARFKSRCGRMLLQMGPANSGRGTE